MVVLCAAIVSASPVCVTPQYVLGVTGPDCVLPSVEGNTPVVNGLPIIANGGKVLVALAGYATSATDIISLDGAPIFVSNAGTPGTEADLGYFAPGTVLTFDEYVAQTGYTYKSGPGKNPDGDIHDATAPWTANSAVPFNGYWIGFEDAYAYGGVGQPNKDFQDISFIIGGATPGGECKVPGVPEPATLALAGIGLLGIGVIGRRRKK